MPPDVTTTVNAALSSISAAAQKGLNSVTLFNDIWGNQNAPGYNVAVGQLVQAGYTVVFNQSAQIAAGIISNPSTTISW
jgi:hypothetical protein